MRISIVTISLNQIKYIEDTITSILNQNYEDLEYIIVDGGSTDGSKDIIEKYRHKISKIIYEKDKGPADGLNKGFRNATGEIFGFVNSDDKLLPNTLNRIKQIYTKNVQIDIVYGNGFIINENGKMIRRIYSDGFDLSQFLYDSVTFIQPSVFMKKDAFWEVGGFNIENRTCWDGELMIDFGIKKKKFLKIKENFSEFRTHSNSFGSTKPGSSYRINLRKDRERIFYKVKGRNKKWFDFIYNFKYRSIKWIKNPFSLIYNLIRIFSFKMFR